MWIVVDFRQQLFPVWTGLLSLTSYTAVLWNKREETPIKVRRHAWEDRVVHWQPNNWRVARWKWKQARLKNCPEVLGWSVSFGCLWWSAKGWKICSAFQSILNVTCRISAAVHPTYEIVSNKEASAWWEVSAISFKTGLLYFIHLYL